MSFRQPPDPTGIEVRAPAALAAAAYTSEWDVWGFESVDLGVDVSAIGTLTGLSVKWQWSPTYPGVSWFDVLGGELAANVQTLGVFTETLSSLGVAKYGFALARVQGRSMRAQLVPTGAGANVVSATIVRR